MLNVPSLSSHERSTSASSARIITGTALIIVIVFSGFARGQLVMFRGSTAPTPNP